MRQLAPLPTHPQRQIKLRAASSLGYSLGHSLGQPRPASALTLNLTPIPTPYPNAGGRRRSVHLSWRPCGRRGRSCPPSAVALRCWRRCRRSSLSWSAERQAAASRRRCRRPHRVAGWVRRAAGCVHRVTGANTHGCRCRSTSSRRCRQRGAAARAWCS